MGVAIVAISLLISISLFVVEGHRSKVEKELVKTKKSEQKLTEEVDTTKAKSTEATLKVKELEANLENEISEKKRLETQNATMVEQCINKSELEKEREKIRSEVENKYKQENTGLLVEQIRLDIREKNKEDYKKRAAGLKDRLMALARNKKSVEEKWAEAMDSMAKMEDSEQRIESDLKLANNGESEIKHSDGLSKYKEDLDALRENGANMRKSMENVRAAIASSMESETEKLMAETTLISDELNRLVMEARSRNAGSGIKEMTLTDSSQLKEQAVSIKTDEFSVIESETSDNKGKLASINGKLKDLNHLMKTVFVKMEEVDAMPTTEVWEPAKVAQRFRQPCPDDAPRMLMTDNSNTFKGPYEIYVVKKGDTLWKISNELFGNPNKWPLLYKYNLYHLDSPHTIQPDMKLIFRPGAEPTQKEIDEAISEARKNLQ